MAVIRSHPEPVRAKDALLPEMHLGESNAMGLIQNPLSQLGISQ